MNWTGGGLSRSRNAKGSLLAKQKNYFAKVRGKLQDGRLLRPATQSFELGAWKATIKIRSSSQSSHRIPARSPTQKTLDQFQNVQPLVQRLNTLKPRRESNKRKRAPPQSSNSWGNLRNGEAQDPIVIGSSQSCSSVSSSNSQAFAPPPQQLHRSLNTDTGADDSIEAKRRRLLRMTDWVGIDYPTAAKPVKMEFADPSDRDLIGRRRKITETDRKQPADTRQLIPRRPHAFIQDARIKPAAHDQYYTVDDISVRIGSAVDRSIREETARRSRGRSEQDSIFSDELLDNEVPASVQKLSLPHTPLLDMPQPAPLRLSDHRRRDVLTPSAFMDDSSARSSSYFEDNMERVLVPSPPVREVRSANGQQSGTGSDLELPNEPPPQGFRLVFESSPRPHAVSPDIDRTHPHFCEIVIHNPTRPTISPNHTLNIEDKRLRQKAVSARHNAPKFREWDVTTPARVQAMPQIRTGLETSTTEDMKFDTRRGNHLESQIMRQADDAAPTNSDTDHQGCLSQPKLQSQNQTTVTGEEDDVWRKFTVLPPQEDTSSSRDELQARDGIASTTSILSMLPRSPTKPKEGDIPKPSEGEEAAWRKIVFGDNDSSSDASQQPQDSNPQYHSHACTQPSLIAEVATSPLKQNPHLVDQTFASSSSYLPEASLTIDSHDLPRRHTRSPSASSPQVAVSGIDISSTAAQPHLPRAWDPNFNRSSLVGEASSSSKPTNPSSNPTISSDELHRSPERVPFLPAGRQATHPQDKPKTTHRPPQHDTVKPPHQPQPHPPPRATEKIIYKKPPRYLGSQSSDPPQPTLLGGRVLRSGKRTGTNGPSKPTRGKWKGKGRRKRQDDEAEGVVEGVDDGEEGDEIVDD